ncbi:MAG: ABC transporter substrate-binding protein [Cyclobacteriaceae bacterium]|nr:ABC transporter substrate-binding protein [Cyclobacteriaceae bacterium]
MDRLRSIIGIFLLAVIISCQPVKDNRQEETEDLRIISIGGAISETISALGLEHNIIAIDQTSTYPPALSEKVQLGFRNSISAESILALNADIIIAGKENIESTLVESLRQMGQEVYVIEQNFSLTGSHALIAELGKLLGRQEKAYALREALQESMDAISPIENKPRALFIYARGKGAMQVSGHGTSAHAFMEISGFENAMQSISQFKPLTPEALIAADPDVLIFFESGWQSLGGADGIMEIPGIAQTKAGKTRNFVTMDGLKMLSFSSRLPEAILELRNKYNNNLQ